MVLKKNKWTIIIHVLLGVILLIVGIIVATMMYGELTKEGYFLSCIQNETVKYENVGCGGLFSRVCRIETNSTDFDGYMTKCTEYVRNINIFGDKVDGA